jgi:hypothetical protein
MVLDIGGFPSGGRVSSGHEHLDRDKQTESSKDAAASHVAVRDASLSPPSDDRPV